MNDPLSTKILDFVYSSPRTEGDCVRGGTRALEQMASTASGLYTAIVSLFLWERGALEKKRARPLVETTSIVSGLQIASAALFSRKEKCKSYLNHSYLF